VFVNSMSDLFHDRVPAEFIQDVFRTMAETRRHTYQVLTKRSARLVRLADRLPWPPNVWMGVSVESQEYVIRATRLARVPAPVRFLSVEPMLGPIDLTPVLPEPDWVIVGGESGPGCRPCDPAWLRSLRDQCLGGWRAVLPQAARRPPGQAGPRPGCARRLRVALHADPEGRPSNESGCGRACPRAAVHVHRGPVAGTRGGHPGPAEEPGMNPKATVGRRPPVPPRRTRVAVLLAAVERASTWELFDADSLPPIPMWVQVASGAGFVTAGILSLIGTLRGGL
jgi:hypothetical protein